MNVVRFNIDRDRQCDVDGGRRRLRKTAERTHGGRSRRPGRGLGRGFVGALRVRPSAECVAALRGAGYTPLVPGVDLSPRTLLRAYASGAFPMTDSDGVTRWYTADPRGVLPLDAFHCPKTLRQIVRQGRFDIRIDHDFAGVMRGCRDAPRAEDAGGWIGDELIRAYVRLHEAGYAHSVEAYLADELVGGLYGVSLGGAFFGESMFHRVANASKVCLVHLVDRLRDRDYVLLDTQMVTGHMKQFGCVYVPAREYERRLAGAMEQARQFA